MPKRNYAEMNQFSREKGGKSQNGIWKELLELLKLMGIAWDRTKELQRNAFPTDGRNIPPPTISGEAKADYVLEAKDGRAAI
ncbi:hypothetical protein niasHT_011918 [Heterodera trifolii]|uniref:Uncharacterized protein n=1 Tax=Heterodera trifolii TaxID=157864 RepID=A0ABD2KY42_9BILA